MGQLDDIPPIRRVPRNPVYADPFRDLESTFRIGTPPEENLPSRGGGDTGPAPQDDDQQDDHPFAISVETLETGVSGRAEQWRVKVLGGTYATGDGSPFTVTGGDYPAVVLNEAQHRSPGIGQLPVKTVAILYVPVEPCSASDTGAVKCSDGRFARAVAGGAVAMYTSVPAAFPVRVFNPTLGPGFVVHLGTWTSRYSEDGVGDRRNRVSVTQLVNDDVVLDAEADTDGLSSISICALRATKDRPEGYTEAEGATKGWVTWGHVNSVVVSNVAESYSLATGKRIYMKVTTNGAIPLRVLTAEIDATTSTREDTGGTATTPPTTAYYLLGQVAGAGTVESPYTVFPSGCGNLQLSAVAMGYSCTLATAGDPGATPPVPASPGGVQTNYQLRWDRVA
jgi:hypothetical protein